MKRSILISVLCGAFLAGIAYSADILSSVNSESNQLYNKSYRDVKDGTNALTTDVVLANSYSNVATTTTVKATGGFLHAVTVNATCATNNVYIADASSLPAISTVIISSVTATLGTYIYDVRFSNALTVGVGAACTSGVTVSYR